MALNFFERQHAARGSTVKLVVLFALAVIAIVAVIDVIVVVLTRAYPSSTRLGFLGTATVFTLAVIAIGTLSKLIALRAGGAAVAQSVGAVPVDPTTSDPRLRRFVNVVEEMSIASGVPTPRLFVLEQEDGINAFAAGYSPADAAVTVTGGALARLNRDELQGVIGHEFSHVLNGDMRLNVRLIGLLNGILLLGLVGLRFLQFGGGRGGKKGNPLLFVAIALVVLGFVGQFFAGLIQAAVSRQREWLADASAVQFTRQTSGLVGALRKIAGLPEGSALRDARAQKQINHMLFGDGSKSISRLYATHPPLAERIEALEPGFDPRTITDAADADGLAEDAAAGFAGRSVPTATAGSAGRPVPTPATESAGRPAPSPAAPGIGASPPGPTGPPAPPAAPAGPAARPDPSAGRPVRVAPAQVVARVATFGPQDLQRGREIRDALPAGARQLAAQPSTAAALVLALLLDDRPDVQARQLDAIAQRLGPNAAAAARQTLPTATQTPPLLRLPLVSLAAPSLAAAPPGQRERLVDALHTLAAADGEISLFEYCLTRLVAAHLRDAADPARRSRAGRGSLAAAHPAALTLLTVVAAAGNADPAAAQHAFAAAAAQLQLDSQSGSAPRYDVPPDCAAALDPVWDRLDALAAPDKQRLIEALVVAIRDDGVVNVAEAELLRTTCALLHCPLPAVLG